jgi:two-component system, chemotaxis family, CheB/CheR fusion protein
MERAVKAKVPVEQNKSSENVETDFPIAGIGASAGGIKALQDFFAALPEKTGAAIVVILHLDPTYQSELASVIAARTRLPVQQVERSASLQPDHVYVIPPNRRLLISDRKVSAVEFDEPRGQRAAIDQFLRSLAAQPGGGFAIILSGAGSDGTLGVRAVKEAGGIVLVQDPVEAEYDSMPRSVIAAGDADFVQPARDLATQFAELVRTRGYLKESIDGAKQDELLGRILSHLKSRTGHDFSQYKRNSIVRRVGRRMQVSKTANLQDYLDYLVQHPNEVQALFDDLLISVTAFFRDRPTFEQLQKKVVPAVFDNMRDECIRVWVPGCATGEEAYSIAILLLEEAAKREINPELQIFGTDIDLKSLAAARKGCYPGPLNADVSEERLLRFFDRAGDQYCVKGEVRDRVVFAQHNIVKDPPFSRLDLISCRNLLIYMDRELQQRIIGIFHYALKPNGYLFLGPSESIDYTERPFRAVDLSARIFQSVERRNGEPPAFPELSPSFHVLQPPIPERTPYGRRTADWLQEHLDALTEAAPPSILVDELHHILHVSQKAGQYMAYPAGVPTLDLGDLVRPELSAELNAMLDRAFTSGESGVSLPVPVQFNGSSRNVCLQVSIVNRPEAPARALVLFIEGGPAQLPVEADEATSSDAEVKRLRDDLRAARANLKLRRQQFENATESLRAANEELQSTNEEYRSTAEELETSREELKSMNEELQTLNAELNSKYEALSRSHSDLQNLIAATDVGTLFLDSGLHVKWFTPRICELFNITTSDEGRQIGDFTHRLDYPDFDTDMRAVIRHGKNIEREVGSADQRVFLTTIRPYHNRHGGTDGVVVTFVDVTKLRKTQDELRNSRARLKASRKKVTK